MNLFQLPPRRNLPVSHLFVHGISTAVGSPCNSPELPRVVDCGAQSFACIRHLKHGRVVRHLLRLRHDLLLVLPPRRDAKPAVDVGHAVQDRDLGVERVALPQLGVDAVRGQFVSPLASGLLLTLMPLVFAPDCVRVFLLFGFDGPALRALVGLPHLQRLPVVQVHLVLLARDRKPSVLVRCSDEGSQCPLYHLTQLVVSCIQLSLCCIALVFYDAESMHDRALVKPRLLHPGLHPLLHLDQQFMHGWHMIDSKLLPEPDRSHARFRSPRFLTTGLRRLSPRSWTSG
mmetsp:Transcript_31575/g.74459  ORF Transcript_31575/g.74459 Transcript_31575/m.74459 type:complete len:287 (+) Transcript_31575:1164-2024(+)